MNMKKKTQSEPIVFKGRKTLPSVPITSNKFEYVPACKTDLRETWRKAREVMGIKQGL
jgi:hypothetical protein